VVAYTELNSPATASEVNLLRGARILEVDGVDLVNVRSDAGIDIFLAGLFPDDIDEDHEFVIQDLNSSETRVISMRSALITWNPVPVVDTIDTTAGKVGYVVFNDHIPASEQKLIDAVSQLNTSVVNDLILDLRYNVGGYLDIASEMAYMIVGPSTAGRTFEKLEFNDKLSYLDETTLFHSEAYGFSADEGLPLPSLDLPRVFVLTSADTCSASEAIINSLRGIGIEVVQIGDTTCGKPYGFAFDGENCGTIYFTIQFRGVNEAGFGDYTDGFSPEDAGLDGTPVPGCFVLDDFTHALGDVEEAQLAAALYYREFGECPTTNSASRLSRSSPDNPLSRSRGTIMKPDWLKNRILTPRNHGLRFGTVP
jgi:hypothetical protein